MIDFPNSPSVGQTFNSGSGAIYVWDGVAWSIATSQTATALSRNRIVNPAMQISQELGATAVTTSGTYIADQWGTLVSGIVFNAAKNSMTSHQISIQATTAKGSLAAGDYLALYQPIEGQRLFDFGYGSTNSDFGYGPLGALPSVLRFDVYCPVAGTYAVSIKNYAANRSLVLPFTVSTINVWTTIVLPIPGDTAGTWVIDNTGGMLINFVFACGTTLQTAVSGWQAGNFFAPTGISNGAATTGTFYLRNVGLYLDPYRTGIPPAFQMPDYNTDLLECSRYWEAKTCVGRWDQQGATSVTTGFAFEFMPKRATPSFATISNTGSGMTPQTYNPSGTSGVAVNVFFDAAGVVARTLVLVLGINARM